MRKKIALLVGVIVVLVAIVFVYLMASPKIVNKVTEHSDELKIKGLTSLTPSTPSETLVKILEAFFAGHYEDIDPYVYIWHQEEFQSQLRCSNANVNTVSECLRSHNQIILGGIKLYLQIEILNERSISPIEIKGQRYEAAEVQIASQLKSGGIVFVKKDNQWQLLLPLV